MFLLIQSKAFHTIVFSFAWNCCAEVYGKGL